MARRVVLLRAVNVGGSKLPMAELREVAQELGARDVSTFIASGNLLVDVDEPEAFDRALERAIEERFGFFREAISRSPEELRAALEAHPFAIEGERKAHHVYFLLEPPSAEQVDALMARGLPDRLAVIGRDLHIRYADGVANTKLTPALILRTLGSHGTGRNLNTVEKLVTLATV
ncbi:MULTISPECIES: DUF1697 domain-containing protein [Aeromicrobium]|uniref:DUF1697 domain-containing protein n=1 Tax=Aeromicrobium TaxID=2040 RepID=UPI00257F6C0E|nr:MULTISPECIES: DUF1697 domain-containing protein [Aeromicrobium]